ncbi:PqqD family protein [Desulfotomaculum sp. 1211_IL3151]|uniref:PqqD family protein n=1 Tax=Desulfotomaculum sp. 1211_IL3151 TaxID=3084055 RepID=UPI002FD9F372
MKIKADYLMREVAGSCVVVPTGKASVDLLGMITLNSTGVFLWKQLAEDKSEQELLCALMEEYDTDEVTASSDISEFIKDWKAADLLE